MIPGTIILFWIACAVAQPAVDPSDSLLLARFLTPWQEAQFSPTDGMVSDFWSDWSGHDSLLLVPPESCIEQPCLLDGPSDASLIVKAAAGAGGLYLAVAVTDDIWIAPQGTDDDWYRDVISLYFDSLSAAQIMAPCPPAWECWTRITTSTHEIRLWAGAVAGMDSSGFGRYVPAAWAWTRSRESLAGMQALAGYGMELLRVGPNQRVLELHIPWDRYCGGLGAGGTLAARRLGFWIGYDDCDTVDRAGYSEQVGWFGRNVWNWDAVWGDIVLPDNLGVVAARGAPGPQHTGYASRARVMTGQPSTLYSLTGRMVKAYCGANAESALRVLVVQGRGCAVERRLTPSR